MYWLILQTIRVTENSKILTDIIFFNNFEFTTITDNITHSIPDHLIQFVTPDDFITPSSPCKSNTYKPNFKNFGFCSNDSTEHILISLLETIKKCLDNDEIVWGDFIHLQKGF